MLDLNFNRIQFTPDLMPSDIIGTNIINETPEGQRVFSFQPGPLFAQIVLADEINRATPKTQSALLEAMQEHSVTVGGTIHRLEEPFFVMATQNPIEQEGTYPLPEAQLDRFFFKLIVNYASRAGDGVILDRTTQRRMAQDRPGHGRRRDPPVAAAHSRGAGGAAGAGLRHPAHPGDASRKASSPPPPPTSTSAAAPARAAPRRLVLAAKVRALLEGRYNVSFEDIRKVYLPALRHRIMLNFEAQAENIASDTILTDVMQEVKEKRR